MNVSGVTRKRPIKIVMGLNTRIPKNPKIVDITNTHSCNFKQSYRMNLWLWLALRLIDVQMPRISIPKFDGTVLGRLGRERGQSSTAVRLEKGERGNSVVRNGSGWASVVALERQERYQSGDLRNNHMNRRHKRRHKARGGNKGMEMPPWKCEGNSGKD